MIPVCVRLKSPDGRQWQVHVDSGTGSRGAAMICLQRLDTRKGEHRLVWKEAEAVQAWEVLP